MAIRLDVIENVLDLAVRTNHEGSPRDAHHLAPVHIFFFHHAELAGNFLLWIGEQRVRQAVFVLKFLLGGGGIA